MKLQGDFRRNAANFKFNTFAFDTLTNISILMRMLKGSIFLLTAKAEFPPRNIHSICENDIIRTGAAPVIAG